MATILTENFNTYADGALDTLVPATGWVSVVGSNWLVQSTTKYEGAKGISHTNAGATTLYKSGTALADGKVTYYARLSAYPNAGGYLSFYVYNSAGAIHICVHFDSAKNIILHDSSVIQAYNLNEWYLVEMEWRSSDHTYRARVNTGTWSAWIAGGGGNWTTLSRIYISSTTGNASAIFLDCIGEDPYGWKHKFMGVAPPHLAKAEGVALANIGKIMGVD